MDKLHDVTIVEQPMGTVLDTLRTDFGWRICFEEVKLDPARDRIEDREGQISWRKKKISIQIGKGSTIKDVLNKLVGLDEAYDWYQYEKSTIYVVYPTTKRTSSSNESEMLWETEAIDAKETALKSVMEEDLKTGQHNIYLLPRPNDKLLTRSITVALRKMPFRDALNAILLKEEDLYWALGGISRRALFLGSCMARLFSIDVKYRSELNTNTFSEGLRQDFAKKGIPLSHVMINIVNKETWVITDRENKVTFTIKGEDGELNIYGDHPRSKVERDSPIRN